MRTPVAFAVCRGGGGSELLLGQRRPDRVGPGGAPAPVPRVLHRPWQAALGMLACAAVAGARYTPRLA